MSDKPLPRVNAINRPFWEGCNRDELVLQQCGAEDCCRHIYYPRVCCPYCQGGDLSWKKVSGRGQIITYTIIHRPQHPSFFPEAPYYVIAVELEEGPLMYSRLTNKPDASENLTGRKVKVVFDNHAPTQKLPFFELA